MPSQFFGLTIASSGLSAFQVSLNTTANNVSNVQTEGYSKQVANLSAGDALRAYAKYGSMGTGVTTTSIKQLRNEYYDVKYWNNQQYVGLYETKLSYLQQIENYFIDDGEDTKGFATILNEMFNDLDSLKNNAASIDTRQQFVGSAENFATYFNATYEGLRDIQSSVNDEIKTTVENINAIGKKVANLNKEINIIEVNGGYANELRDERALLIDELSSLVPTEVSEVAVVNSNDPEMPLGANYYTVTIGGQTLVDTYDNYTLTCVSRDYKVNQSDVEGLYDIKWTDTGNSFHAGASSMNGTLKALFDIRDGNNGENFSGKVTGLDTTNISAQKLTITDTNMNSVEEMTMPESGKLYINGNYYSYSDFSFVVNADDTITYTFDMTDDLRSVYSKLSNRTATIGSSVDTMGVPYYQQQLNSFVRSFAAAFNDIMLGGDDLNGDEANYSFFTGNDNGTEYNFGTSIAGLKAAGATSIAQNADVGTSYSTYAAQSSSKNTTVAGNNYSSYYKLTAANFCVNSEVTRDPSRLAATSDITGNKVDAYDIAEKLEALKSDTKVYRNGTAEGFLKSIISDISIDTQESKIFYNNYSNIENTMSNQRMSISGVDEDEEGMDLVKFQNAYNLSSKMVSVMAEIYDRLILETGV